MKVYRFNEHSNLDEVTIDFINGRISESEFKDYINTEVLNESVISYVKEKIIKSLFIGMIHIPHCYFPIIFLLYFPLLTLNHCICSTNL